MAFCEECFDKQRKLDELEEEVKRLKAKLREEEKKLQEGYFGSSTPSSKKPFKNNNTNNPKKNGGGVKGHIGYGRRKMEEEEADIVENIYIGNKCPHCNGELEKKGTVNRGVIDSEPAKINKKLYVIEKGWCPICKKTIIPKPPVLNKSLYGNELTAEKIVMHYGHGVTVGTVEKITENIISSGSIYNIFHRVASYLLPAIPKLIEEYRQEHVKHADETGWGTDGESGYAWLFCSKNISIFQFENTRSGKIPQGIFGNKELPGVLLVDRYAGYNKTLCRIQYCYAHLLRKIKDLGKEFMEDKEVQNFVDSFAPLLSEAMHLRGMKITDKQYYKRARKIKNKILELINAPARHFGIKEIQLIFKENEKRLYHWVSDRKIPAENNRAERELRPTVIARKISFGSQSEKGASTRSILMTILHTAEKRLNGQSLKKWFKQLLDQIALNPNIDPYSLLPARPS